MSAEMSWAEADREEADPWVAVMPLAGPGVLVTALADDTRTLRQRLTWSGRQRQLNA